ncbi:MAG TPA: beta-ketoacyl synthase N-terminal-like domain-containing protein [bacterium]|nr:beta-ketoacyl synthase N-terminal-like domain-containing protein [bacterium]
MKKAFIIADNIFSPLGKTSCEVFENMAHGKSSVKLVENGEICRVPAYLSVFDEKFENKFESICINSIHGAVSECGIDPKDPQTLFILSTTKGNIGVPLNKTAEIIAEKFGFINNPLVISNACISGVVAITIAERLIKKGGYRNIVVTGADILTDFIVSGFQSLKAIGSTVCRPFDVARNGINLGECAATVILSSDAKSGVEVTGGAFNGDANHISGPSRTAEGLYLSISRTMNGFNGLPSFISAHGTATSFNDEMESIGFDRAGLNDVPLNSLKPYFGHTLGAAGIAEIIISAHSIQKGIALKTPGYENHGVTRNITVLKENMRAELTSCLKTASGFGGCNASVLLVKNK